LRNAGKRLEDLSLIRRKINFSNFNKKIIGKRRRIDRKLGRDRIMTRLMKLKKYNHRSIRSNKLINSIFLIKIVKHCSGDKECQVKIIHKHIKEMK
jgi:hypothetical protein